VLTCMDDALIQSGLFGRAVDRCELREIRARPDNVKQLHPAGCERKNECAESSP
jgi:hypothetical protein